MEQEGSALITKTTCPNKNDYGYMWTYVDNQDSEATYKESVTYSRFEGLELVAPYSGSKYELTCRPLEKECVMLKCSMAGHSLKLSIGEQVILSDPALIQKALSDGEKIERAPGIF